MESGDRLDELVGTQLLARSDIAFAGVLIESCEDEQLVLIVPAGRWFGRSVLGLVMIVGHRLRCSRSMESARIRKNYWMLAI